MDMDDEEDYARKMQRRRRTYLYASFLTCLLGGALMGAALGTDSWVTAEAYYSQNISVSADYTGTFHGGLFRGASQLEASGTARYDYYMVCVEGKCMYSCADPKDMRQDHLRLILAGNISAISDPVCLVSSSKAVKSQSRKTRSIDESRTDYSSSRTIINHKHPDLDDTDLYLNSRSNHVDESTNGDSDPAISSSYNDKLSNYIESSGLKINVFPLQIFDSLKQNRNTLAVNEEPLRSQRSSDDDMSETSGLMSQGLWVGTIACLCVGLLFAIAGAIFAIINTATTPVELITGVPGLYIWNSLAALFTLVAVVLWSVLYHTSLSHNVLIEQSKDGWTTEGNEALGYSFWLVVVAIIVHVANCGLVAFGTYEPKSKEKIQEPDKATNDILLY